MPAGYTRQAAANIQPGLRANAEDLNAEYNALAGTFDNALGHDHSGSVAGDGAKIPLGSAVSGVLPVANGGTGNSASPPVFTAATFNPGGVLIGAAGTVPPQGQLTLNANNSPPASGGGSNLYIVGADGAAAFVGLDVYSNTAGTAPTLYTRRMRGTALGPAGVQNGDLLWTQNISGRNSGGTYPEGAAINAQATETWTGSNGTQLQFYTTPTGSGSLTPSLVLSGNSASFSGDVGINGAQGITYSAFTGGGSDNSQHRYRFGWSGAHLVVSVDSTGGLQLANASDLAAYLPLSGGTLSGHLQANAGIDAVGTIHTPGEVAGDHSLATSGYVYVNGPQWSNNGGRMYTGSSLWTSGSVQADASGTALYLPNGNLSMGGYGIIAGVDSGNLALHCTSGCVEADFFGTAFYAPNGGVVCVTCSANNFINTSDVSLKEHIADSGVGLEAVLRLAPKSFRWKDSERDQLGLIAQDVADVLPEAVATTASGGVHEPLMGIDYAAITTALVGAAHELADRIKSLEAELAALKAAKA